MTTCIQLFTVTTFLCKTAHEEVPWVNTVLSKVIGQIYTLLREESCLWSYTTMYSGDIILQKDHGTIMFQNGILVNTTLDSENIILHYDHCANLFQKGNFVHTTLYSKNVILHKDHCATIFQTMDFNPHNFLQWIRNKVFKVTQLSKVAIVILTVWNPSKISILTTLSTVSSWVPTAAESELCQSWLYLVTQRSEFNHSVQLVLLCNIKSCR